MTDPLMNPPAPSGRYDDSSLTTQGERIALPSGTRRYVDAGGAKHYILPDGTTRYVPPGEVGNFYLEDEDPQAAMRRHLVQELQYADAVRVNARLDALFGELDELRKMGADMQLVPANPDANKGLAERLKQAYQNRPVRDYPKAKYHPEHGFRAVANKDEEGDLGDGWHDNPDDAKAVRSGPKAHQMGVRQRDEDRAQQRAEDAQSEEGDDSEVRDDPRIEDMDRTFIGDTGGVIKPDVAPADKPKEVR